MNAQLNIAVVGAGFADLASAVISKNMRWNFMCALLVLTATPALCAEWGGLHGSNTHGETISVNLAKQNFDENEKNHFFGKPAFYDIEVYKEKRGKKGERIKLNGRTFKHIKCVSNYFSATLPKSGIFFNCENKSGFPLAGAAYKQFLPKQPLSTKPLSEEEEYRLCLSGKFDPVYTCVSGCKNSPLTPKKLTEPPYECE